jgi:hypothetical protein
VQIDKSWVDSLQGRVIVSRLIENVDSLWVDSSEGGFIVGWIHRRLIHRESNFRRVNSSQGRFTAAQIIAVLIHGRVDSSQDRFIVSRFIADCKVDSSQGRLIVGLIHRNVDSSQGKPILGRCIVGRFIVGWIHELHGRVISTENLNAM